MVNRIGVLLLFLLLTISPAAAYDGEYWIADGEEMVVFDVPLLETTNTGNMNYNHFTLILEYEPCDEDYDWEYSTIVPQRSIIW